MINQFRFIILVAFTVALYFTFFLTPADKKLSVRSPLSVSNSFTILYFGQNKLGQLSKDMDEPSLYEVCSTSPHSVIILSFLRKHFSTNGLPGLSLSKHCTKTMFTSDKFGADFYPLNCAALAEDIQKCQGLGKKIVLSVSPLDILESADDAKKSALNVWNLFFGGTSKYRPFGDVVLDGIDLFFRTNDMSMITVFTETLFDFFGKYSKKKLSVSATPGCTYPDGTLGPVWQDGVFTKYINKFSWVTLNGLGSPDCTYRNKDTMFVTIKKWFDFVPKTVPVYFLLAAQEGHIDDSPGDFIPTEGLPEITTKLSQISKDTGKLFAGYAVWEASAEFYGQACTEDDEQVKTGEREEHRTYGDVANRNVELASKGQKIQGIDVCTYPKAESANVTRRRRSYSPSPRRSGSRSNETNVMFVTILLILTLFLLL